MSDSGENKYKWTPESTSLLVSVWTDKQVQKQLEYSSKPQLIWESVAKYMNKKGYSVSGKQCRSRMKQVLVCYREAKRAGTRAAVEQYYESIDRVLKLKRDEIAQTNNNNDGIDTVDSTANVKSPPKDVKTNKNLQMRYKYQQPAESIFRTEALSPILSGGRDEDYPDSPESNETVLAQPFRVFSPVRDAATNTTQHQLGQANKKVAQHGMYEEPIKETYRQNTFSNNYFSEIPYQNTVQNVQNQIIQENMQQNQALLQQNLLQNHLLEQNRLQMNPVLRQNLQNLNHGAFTEQGMPYNSGQLGQLGVGQSIMADNVLRMHNKCQLNTINRAVPQEPRKSCIRQNLAATHRQFQDAQIYNANFNQLGFLSPSISPDIPPNLNEAFCQSKSEKAPGLNETFTRTSSDPLNLGNIDMSTVTNNATFNDDTISIEFLQDSPSPDSEQVKLKDFAVNTDENMLIPNAPARKKKAEKLERLMINAINSQNEVVNKILAAQNDMVSRVLDLDRDRQNRLENRLDHLIDVVQTAVLNKSGDKSGEIPPAPPEPLITNLMPPPKPGVIPPKLDLVPPKPCRVPCTTSSTTCQAVNQNPVTTRPGVISPIMSPSRKVGPICQKLGPVSTSPFVRAQQQLGFRPVNGLNGEVRTQSSAERRIAKEFSAGMDTKSLILETANFLEAERQIQEEVENARIKSAIGEELQARRRLFTQREPNAAMILTAAFLEAEIQAQEIAENARLNWIRNRQRENGLFHRPSNDNYRLNDNVTRDKLLAGQGDTYERLRQLNMRERVIGDPCESSTPAKIQAATQKRDYEEVNEPRQTIQQLAQLVMNSARWRNNQANQGVQRKDLNFRVVSTAGDIVKPSCPDEEAVMLRKDPESNKLAPFERQQLDGRAKSLNWINDRFSYGGQPSYNPVDQETATRRSYDPAPPKPSRPMTVGFTTEFLKNEENNNARKQPTGEPERRVGFVLDNDIVIDDACRNRLFREDKDPFEELHQFYIQKQLQLHQSQGLPFMMHNGKIVLGQHDMIERYAQDSKKKPARDSDSDNDEEFLDTTTSMPSSRKNSLTSVGTKSAKSESNCIIS